MAGAGLKGVFDDRYARVIQLKRRKKQLFALTVGNGAGGAMTSKGQVLIFLSNLRTVPRARLSC